MLKVDSAWEEHQRKRWMRPDGTRWIKPPRYEPEPKSIQPPIWTDECDAELEAIRHEYLELKWMRAERRLDIARWEFLAKASNPAQPRVPAGDPKRPLAADVLKYSPDQPRDDHGRWTSDGGQATDLSSARKKVDVRVSGGGQRDSSCRCIVKEISG